MRQLVIGLRQRLGAQILERQPEVDVVMYDQEQDEQFTRDGEDGALAVLYEIVVDAVLTVAPHAGSAVDLGCGSGQLLCRIAAEMPQMRFVGLDLSANMLRFAERTAGAHGLDNVRFARGSWFELDELGEGSFDLVTWHLASHHCDSPEDVVRVLNAASRLLKPDGTLFLLDIIRPKSGRLAVQLADMYSMRWGSWFYQDTLDSYKAAFSYPELAAILAASELRDYRHVQPPFFNFWQVAYCSRHRNERPRRRTRLKHLAQKRDYLLLKTFLGRRI